MTPTTTKSLAEREAVWRRISALGGDQVLTEEKAERTKVSVLRVLALMLDGRWHDPAEIRRVAGDGAEATAGLRRLRELRGLGFHVERSGENDRGFFHHRLPTLPRKPQQQALPLGEVLGAVVGFLTILGALIWGPGLLEVLL